MRVVSTIRLIGVRVMFLVEVAQAAAYDAVCAIRPPEGLTDAQEHQFWTAVIAYLEQRSVYAREKLGPPPTPVLAVIRSDNE